MNKVKAGKTASFPSLNAHLEDENFSRTELQDIIKKHISKLIAELNKHIPENPHKHS